MARVESRYGECRAAMGAVPGAEPREQRHLDLREGELRPGCREPAVPARAGRTNLARRSWFPAASDGDEHPVVEPLAARRRGVGRARRWPTGRAVFLCDGLRFHG